MTSNNMRLDNTVAESESISVEQPLENYSSEAEPLVSESDAAQATDDVQTIEHVAETTSDDVQEKTEKLSVKKKIIIGGASSLLVTLVATLGFVTFFPQDNQVIGVWKSVSSDVKDLTKSLFSNQNEEMFRPGSDNPFAKDIPVTNGNKQEKPLVSGKEKLNNVNDVKTEIRSDDNNPALSNDELVQAAKTLDSDIKNSVASSLSEVAVVGTTDKEEQLSIVLNGVNSERIALGKAPLTETEMIGTIVYSSQKLGIKPNEAKTIISKTKKLNQAKQLAEIELKAKNPSNDIEKAELIVGRISEVAPEINSSDLTNIALSVAHDNNVSSPLIKQVIAGNAAENDVVNNARKTPGIADEDILYSVTESAVTANTVAQTVTQKPDLSKQEIVNAVIGQTKLPDGTTAVTRTLEQQQKTLKKTAKTLNSSSEAIAIVSAKLTAKNKALREGKPIEAQELAGEIAAAEAKADNLQLNTYEAALYVAGKTNSAQAIDSVAINRNMNPTAKEIATAHHEARQKIISNDKNNGAKRNDSKTIADIAKVVSNTADRAKLTKDENKFFVDQAIEIEAKALGVADSVKKVELARALAEIDAKSEGLGELAVVAVGTGVAAIAAPNIKDLTPKQLNSEAIKQAIAVVKTAGLNQEAEAEVSKSVEKFLTKASIGEKPETKEKTIKDVITRANEIALKEKLSPIERDAFVAKARTEFKAADHGLNKAQTKVAVARAQARARAESMGFSEPRVIDIEMRAGTEAMAKMNLTEQEVQILSHAVVKMETNVAVDKQLASNTVSEENLMPINPVNVDVHDYRAELQKNIDLNNEIKEQQNRLEVRVANLAEKVNQTLEAANKAIESNASLARTIVQLQAAVNSNAVELKNQREAAQTEIDRRNSNSGWISSRVCEIEAAAGNFSNPTVCKVEYAKYRGQPVSQQRQVTTAPIQSYSLPVNTLNDVTSAQLPGVPATSYANEFANGNDRIYAQIPDSVVPNEHSAQYVAHDACTASNANYSYVILSENTAVITNRAGASQRVVKGSYIPDLGAVVMFQAKVEPRFISFDNGIVCKQDFTGS
jgi:hypothetical protein